ncbi:MAG: HipA domain-containing protein [Lutibacter sp.]|nr:HipA domain-containing protein [Lutibacter sp.]MBP9600982.1 HipA domain-containing protein [Lutibacter sp.]
MDVHNLKYCPGTLAEGYTTYSNTCLRKVFMGKKVTHILPYNTPQNSEEINQLFIENRKRISISGVQEKLSLVLEKNVLRLTKPTEQGTYILKPIPRDLLKVDQVPANEHLTMQIAKQVYKINTAENALIFFNNGSPAYITKRFDIKKDGTKLGKEDFASLAGKTTENGGDNFKYEYSYEEIATLIKKYVQAYTVEIEKFYAVCIFNYLFNNGDAHLKNFALLETDKGDYLLSPFYDLLNTHIHVNDTAMALDEGLFANDYETESFIKNGFYAYDDFYEFALKIGIKKSRAIKILQKFCAVHPLVEELVKHSFLSEEAQKIYVDLYHERLKALNYSYSKQL